MMKIVQKLSLVCVLTCSLLFPPLIFSAPMMPGGAGDALFDMPTPEEMQAIEEFLQTLSPEELDQLAALGEEIIKEAEAEGRPLFSDTPAPQLPLEKPKEPKKEDSNTTEKPTDREKEKQKQRSKKTLYNLLVALLDLLNEIRQKAHLDERYWLILAPINADLHTFVYYLHTIKDSRHLTHLADEEFVGLKNELTTLENDLRNIAEKLEIPSVLAPLKMSKHEREQRRRAIQRAEQLIQQCAARLTQSFHGQSVLKECEKLLKKYEPEAVKIKDEYSKRSKIADEQTKKLPVTNTGKIIQAPSYGTKSAHYAPVSRGSSTGTTVPSSYANERGGMGGGGGYGAQGSTGAKPGSKGHQPSKGKGSDGKTEGEKSSSETKMTPDEKQKARAKIKEEFDDVKSLIKTTNKTAFKKQAVIDRFLGGYIGSEASDRHLEEEIEDALKDINHDLNRAKKKYDSWLSKAETQLERREVKDQIRQYAKFLDDEAQALSAIRNKFIELNRREDVVDEKYDIIEEDMKDFNTAYDKITKKVIETPDKKKEKSINNKQQKQPKKRSDSIISNVPPAPTPAMEQLETEYITPTEFEPLAVLPIDDEVMTAA